MVEPVGPPEIRECLCCGGPAGYTDCVVFSVCAPDGEQDEQVVHVYSCNSDCVSWNEILEVERPYRMVYADDALSRELLPEELRGFEEGYEWPEMPQPPQIEAPCHLHGGSA